MKLLLDQQNLSYRLVTALHKEFPGSQHVRDVGLKDAMDEAVWNYAVQHGLTIVTKDADFHQRSFLFGHPPKVVWLRCGNCSTSMIESISDGAAETWAFLLQTVRVLSSYWNKQCYHVQCDRAAIPCTSV